MTDEFDILTNQPGFLCGACGWWQWEQQRRPRPTHCPDCLLHHKIKREPLPVWVRIDPREVP